MAFNYFEEQIQQGKPIVPPTPEQAPSAQQAEPQAATEFIGLPVRAGGDRIFLLKGGRKYWITSAEVYEKLGFKFGDEVKIDQETLDVLQEGEPIRI